MSVNQVQSAVTARVWRAIAQSGLDVSGVSREDMNKLVDIVVDAALEEVDAQLTQVNQQDAAPTASSGEAESEEVVLWEGRPFLSLTVHYKITNERVRVTEGLLGKNREDIELVRIQDIDYQQTLAERAFSLGDIHIVSHDPSRPEVTLENIKDPHQVHEILRRAVLKAREKHGLYYREEM